MDEKRPKRRWVQLHLATAVLAMLLFATGVQLNLSGQFNPVGIFVYDEYSWDSWSEIDDVHIPPRQRVIVAEPRDDYSEYGLSFNRTLGFPFVYGRCAPRITTSKIISAIWNSSFQESNRYVGGFEPSNEDWYDLLISPRNVVYDGVCWICAIGLFCFSHEWLLRRRDSRVRRVISARRNRMRTALLIAAAIILLGAQAIERVDYTEEVHNGTPRIHEMIGVAQFRGRGWPFTCKYSSPVELPFPTNPTLEIDTAINASAVCSNLVVAAIIILGLHLLSGLCLSTRPTAAIT